MTESGPSHQNQPRTVRGKSFSLCQSVILLTICTKFCLADAPVALYIGIRLADSSYAKVKQLALDSLAQVYTRFPGAEIKADIEEIQIKDGQTL